MNYIQYLNDERAKRDMDPFVPHEMQFDDDEIRKQALASMKAPPQEGARLREQKLVRLGQLLKKRFPSRRDRALQKLQQNMGAAPTGGPPR